MQMTIKSYNNEIDRIKGVVAHWAESLSSSPSTSSSSSSPLSSWSRSGLVPHMAVSLPLAPLPSPTPCKSPAGSPATLSFPVLCGEAYILHIRHISGIVLTFIPVFRCKLTALLILSKTSPVWQVETQPSFAEVLLQNFLIIYKKDFFAKFISFLSFSKKIFFANFISFSSFSKKISLQNSFPYTAHLCVEECKMCVCAKSTKLVPVERELRELSGNKRK